MKSTWPSRSLRTYRARTNLRQWPGQLFHRLSSTAPSSASASDVERVEVRCGSSGFVTVDFHDLSKHPDSTPLLIHLPPFAVPADALPYRPTCLRRYPTAVINYRWTGPSSLAGGQTSATAQVVGDFDTPLHWPTPLHDVSFAYKWITENLSPPSVGRRDVYVHGAYLGATLAASLALTESHSHARMGIRGFIAYNGIYNWTMFLPEHKINKPAGAAAAAAAVLSPTPLLQQPAEGSAMRFLQQHMPVWFKSPADLFDPFVSPSLFFQTSGMLVPPSFAQTDALSAMIDKLAALGIHGSPADLMASSGVFRTPRRSALVFPPRKSTLKIPAGLLLHDATEVAGPRTSSSSSSSSTTSAKKEKKEKKKNGRAATTKTGASSPDAVVVKRRRRKVRGNHFEAQATELAGLMRRSLEKLEIPLRMKWDEDLGDGDEVVKSRVRVEDVGEPKSEQMVMEVNERGEELVRRWLEERISL
ncbi:hypothetical protein SODALDRAFT_315413 [Sodiomyces alkalinus F11]|uniref:Alpha/beta-hydrolase n=1 Tax=Sodiomyces alkalinus (strain CBS 110278 / VKM F-3762 / F11) TaxID=1314773 RepID=A0A3N2PPR6_SODAK|nr:hypothetical protein SODALDRAFT_315413 [Sodiomyces alkalinus F11]ROT36503.1 hypothetical protein SODALDRAFT_315413 [Sodiomyces alkalinus F11]